MFGGPAKCSATTTSSHTATIVIVMPQIICDAARLNQSVCSPPI
jgi:hypothetical protein